MLKKRKVHVYNCDSSLCNICVVKNKLALLKVSRETNQKEKRIKIKSKQDLKFESSRY